MKKNPFAFSRCRSPPSHHHHIPPGRSARSTRGASRGVSYLVENELYTRRSASGTPTSAACCPTAAGYIVSYSAAAGTAASTRGCPPRPAPASILSSKFEISGQVQNCKSHFLIENQWHFHILMVSETGLPDPGLDDYFRRSKE